MKSFLLSACVLLALLSGCSSISSRSVVDLGKFKHVYVQHRLTDDHRIDQLIVQELQRRGYDASSGPLTMLPENAEVLLTYEDRWEWDFKTYLIELTVELNTARTEKKLAEGRYYAPSPKSHPPEAVVRDLLQSVFQAKNQVK